MINVASLYHFNLLQRLSPKYKENLRSVVKRIHSYLKEEDIHFSQEKKILGEYEILILKLTGVGEIYFFQRVKYSHKLYYLPSFFAEIYINHKLIKNTESEKKVIFLLSNIFECFDEFEERNILIEFHDKLSMTKNDRKKYFLRHDFQNINSLGVLYKKENLEQKLKNFTKQNTYLTMSEIKNNFPDMYRALLYLVYNIFAIHASLRATQEQLEEVHSFQKKTLENPHISLSEERLKLNKASLEEILPVYKASFEQFMHIISGRKM